MEFNEHITPRIELLFLKRNALVVCALGIALLGYLISEEAGVVGLGIIVVFFIRLMLALPNWKYLFWNGNCVDEYYNFLNARANKYALVAVTLISGFLFAMTRDMEGSGPSGNDVAAIITIVTCFSYSLPLLLWLRADNDA